MINIAIKILVALFNLHRPSLRLVDNFLEKHVSKNNEMLVVLIDYNGFKNRTRKNVGGNSYECGKAALDFITTYCINEGVDYIHLLTSDDVEEGTFYPILNQINVIKNGGTDVFALKQLVGLIGSYANVVVANSSCAVEDAMNVDKLISFQGQVSTRPFIVGFNANSRTSPRIPLISPKYPHIITNLFKTRSIELIEILNSEDNYLFPFSRGGYKDKYFAIRYFETFLSRWILHKGGDLTLLTDKAISYSLDPWSWPKRDTRISRFF